MIRFLSTVLTLLALSGCTFSRTVVNGYVRELDTSWIKPGKTTRPEVIARLGMPPAMVGAKGVRPGTGGAMGALLGMSGKGGGMAASGGLGAEGEVDGRMPNALRWYASDSYTKMFEGGYILYPTLSATRQHRGHDIFILFDRHDVVKLLSRVEMTDDKVRLLEWREAAR